MWPSSVWRVTLTPSSKWTIWEKYRRWGGWVHTLKLSSFKKYYMMNQRDVWHLYLSWWTSTCMMQSKASVIIFQKIVLSTICINYWNRLTTCIETVYSIGTSSRKIFYWRRTMLNWLILDRVEEFTPSSPIPSIFQPDGIVHRSVSLQTATMVIKWICGALDAYCSRSFLFSRYFLATMKWIRSTKFTTFWALLKNHCSTTSKSTQPTWSSISQLLRELVSLNWFLTLAPMFKTLFKNCWFITLITELRQARPWNTTGLKSSENKNTCSNNNMQDLWPSQVSGETLLTHFLNLVSTPMKWEATAPKLRSARQIRFRESTRTRKMATQR